jgi:hypothetical protein
MTDKKAAALAHQWSKGAANYGLERSFRISSLTVAYADRDHLIRRLGAPRRRVIDG